MSAYPFVARVEELIFPAGKRQFEDDSKKGRLTRENAESWQTPTRDVHAAKCVIEAATDDPRAILNLS
jgi:hypothetical protein